jgi:hypothetical protein
MNISVLKSINSLFNTSSIYICQNDRMISSVSELENMQVPLRGIATILTVGRWMGKHNQQMNSINLRKYAGIDKWY